MRDRRVVAAQIGRAARGLSAVARRCRHGYPQVVRVHPIIDGKPFPTLYWLTCPWLRKAVDRLEAGGRIAELETRLSRDPEAVERLSAANDAYVAERMELLSRSEVRELRSRNLLEGLLRKGIGGIADLRGLKCLHLHVAHALVRENPVGELVLAELGAGECGANERICSTLQGVEQIPRSTDKL